MTDKVQEEFKKCLINLVVQHPFFGSPALGLKLVQTKELPTMATDGKSLMYNPDFFKSKQKSIQLAAICHEILHVIFAHPARLYGREAVIWNMATDYAINLILKDYKFELEPTWLYDTRFRGMSADQIYKILMQEIQEAPNQGDGDGQGQQGVKKPHNGKGQGKQCACGGLKKPVHDDGTPLSPGEIKQMEQEAKTIMAQARNVAKAIGKMPEFLDRLITDWLTPKISWVDTLRYLMEEVTRDDYDWRFTNRKYMGGGIMLPSLRTTRKQEIVVGFDTSGSISHDLIRQFAGELSDIITNVNVSGVHVVYCDTTVKNPQYFDKSDLPIEPEYFKPKGGGGTMFSPVFKWIEEQGIEPAAVVYLSDMYCNDFGTEPECPVFWGAFRRTNDVEKIQVPFGEVVPVEI